LVTESGLGKGPFFEKYAQYTTIILQKTCHLVKNYAKVKFYALLILYLCFCMLEITKYFLIPPSGGPENGEVACFCKNLAVPRGILKICRKK